MSKSEPNDFSCPGCEAEYKVVTIDAPIDALHGKIACLKSKPVIKGRGPHQAAFASLTTYPRDYPCNL